MPSIIFHPKERSIFVAGFLRTCLQRFLPITILLLFLNDSMFGQETESNYGYRFEVNEITNPAEAKALLLHFSQNDIVSSFNFIDGCDCFKITTELQLSYLDLKNILTGTDYVLNGDVATSYGLVLSPPDASPQKQP